MLKEQYLYIILIAITLSTITDGHLGQISKIVAFHLQIEHFRLGIACLGYEKLVQ